MRYFATDNIYGSETSRGSSNTEIVYAFDSKKLRDAFVDNSQKLSVDKIKKTEISSFLSSSTRPPRAFYPECWSIVNMGDIDIKGCIGCIEVTSTSDAEKFHVRLF